MSITTMDKVKRIGASVAVIAGLAVGGAAIANAASSDSTSTATTPSVTADQSGGPASQGTPPQRSDETLLTGDTATKVEQAGLEKAGGGTVIRVETDADGNAAYEAHIRKSDGSIVTVYVDKSFNVVGVDQGMGGPQGGAPPASSSSNA